MFLSSSGVSGETGFLLKRRCEASKIRRLNTINAPSQAPKIHRPFTSSVPYHWYAMHTPLYEMLPPRLWSGAFVYLEGPPRFYDKRQHFSSCTSHAVHTTVVLLFVLLKCHVHPSSTLRFSHVQSPVRPTEITKQKISNTSQEVRQTMWDIHDRGSTQTNTCQSLKANEETGSSHAMNPSKPRHTRRKKKGASLTSLRLLCQVCSCRVEIGQGNAL